MTSIGLFANRLVTTRLDPPAYLYLNDLNYLLMRTPISKVMR